MTCIAALIDDNGAVWVGGDSAGVDVYADSLEIREGLEEKVWSNGGVIFGGCGSFRIMQLLRWQLNVPAPAPDDEVMSWLTGVFIDSMRGVLECGGALTRWDTTSTEEIDESGYLLACQGRLFEVYSDFGVGEYREGYAAIGCGRAFALGSLHATVGQKPKKRITAALEAAERFSAGVRGPFTIEKMT